MPDATMDVVRQFLPKYLSPERTRELFSELSKFPENYSVYLNEPMEGLLQGDGWKGLIAINFHSGERKPVSGLILSNTCDISTENSAKYPARVVFAPLIALERFKTRLAEYGQTESQIESYCRAIRRQEATEIFYLPARLGSFQESIVLLNDLHAHPLDHFLSQERSLLFSLNQYGFYVFVIKLSIHFSRLNEGVVRFAKE